MQQIKAYGVLSAVQSLGPLQISRRDAGADDVAIDIAYCGVCHSDIHQARNEWGNSIYPMVPGHEIVGIVTKAGAKVSRFKIGDKVALAVWLILAASALTARKVWNSSAQGPSSPTIALKKTIKL